MYLFCDIETTGFAFIRQPPISLSFIIAKKDLSFVARKTFKCKPLDYLHWSDEAENIHGITKQQTIKFQEPKDCALAIREWLINSCVLHPIFVCHALFIRNHFDYTQLSEWHDALIAPKKDHKSFCQLFGSPSKVETTALKGLHNKKLSTWAEHIGFNLDHHNSESDVEACYEIYKHQNRERNRKRDTSVFGLT